MPRGDPHRRWPLLRGGVVLVDTPGAGSIHQHNTVAARHALLDADGAVVVFYADSLLSEVSVQVGWGGIQGLPLSETRRKMLVELRDRQAWTFLS